MTAFCAHISRRRVLETSCRSAGVAFARRSLFYPVARTACRIRQHDTYTGQTQNNSTVRKPQDASTRAAKFGTPIWKPYSFSMARGKPLISEGHDYDTVLKALLQLQENQWMLDESAAGIQKEFKFTSWTRCLDFVNNVGVQCKVKKHHPTITLTYGLVRIHWTTHRPPGLSLKDTEMARYCDEQALDIGASWRGLP